MPAPELRIVFTPDGAATVESAVVRTERAAAKAQAEAAKAAAASEAATSKIAGASRQASFALETMARQGQVAGEPLRQLLSIGGEMAFMFGPQGVIAGAVASLGLAMMSAFSRARDEAKKAQEDMLKDFRSFGRQIRSADVGSANEIAARLYSGDQFADTEGERLGLGRIRTELSQMTSLYGAAAIPMQRFQDLMKMGQFVGERYEMAMRRLKETLGDVVGGQQRSMREANAWMRAGSLTLDPRAGMAGGASPMAPGTFRTARLGDPLSDYLGELNIRAQVPTTLKNNPLQGWFEQMGKEVAQRAAELKAKLEAEGAALGSVFSGSLADGIATAVRTGDIGEGFKQLTAGLLAGIGGMMIQTGQAMVKFGALIEAFKNALMSFFGGSAVAAGIALIAIGAGLQGLSGALGNTGPRVSTGGDRAVGGGLGIPGTATIPVSLPRQPWERQAAGMGVAEPRPMIGGTWNIFGPRDPSLPQFLMDALETAGLRGYRIPGVVMGAG